MFYAYENSPNCKSLPKPIVRLTLDFKAKLVEVKAGLRDVLG